MDRCTGRRDVTETPLKTALKTIQSINQPEHELMINNNNNNNNDDDDDDDDDEKSTCK